MAVTSVSTRSKYRALPASASGSIATNAWPIRGRLPSSTKNELA